MKADPNQFSYCSACDKVIVNGEKYCSISIMSETYIADDNCLQPHFVEEIKAYHSVCLPHSVTLNLVEDITRNAYV